MKASNYKPTHRVFMFSGGSTSAYMVLKYYAAGDIVVFADTGREHELTYKFIADFQRYTGIPILIARYKNSTNPFRQLLEDKKNRKLPTLHRRFCTIELKIKPIKKLLKSMGVIQFEQMIGFRADEPQRVKKREQPYKKVVDVFPLYRDGVTKKDIDLYWQSMPFKLEVPRILGNCTLCFMKGHNAIIKILSMHPELAAEWLIDEKLHAEYKPNGENTYNSKFSISQMLTASQQIQSLPFQLQDIEPAYNCACS